MARTELDHFLCMYDVVTRVPYILLGSTARGRFVRAWPTQTLALDGGILSISVRALLPGIG